MNRLGSSSTWKGKSIKCRACMAERHVVNSMFIQRVKESDLYGYQNQKQAQKPTSAIAESPECIKIGKPTPMT
jgi:hypothetical protein